MASVSITCDNCNWVLGIVDLAGLTTYDRQCGLDDWTDDLKTTANVTAMLLADEVWM
jgi:hypothetical protein